MTTAPDVFHVTLPSYTPTVQYSARQKQILDGLLQIVLSEGFRNLRLTTLTKQLNTSFSTLYDLASSRDELVALVIERWYHHACTGAYDRLRAAHDPVACLKVWTDFGVVGVSTTSRAFWHDVNAHIAIRGIVATYTHYYVEVLRAILDYGIEQGTFRNVNTRMLAVIWESTTALLADSDYLREEPQTLREQAEDWIDLILNGILRS